MKKDDRPNETTQRQRILKSAAVLFAERGYHAIGMAELGEAVQLGRGTLYHHIRSKEDLLYDIASEYIADLAERAEELERVEANPRQRVVELGNQLVHKIVSHQAELTVCFREIQSLTEPRRSDVIALHKRYEDVWRRAIADGDRLRIFRPYDSILLKGVLGMYFYSYLWIRNDRELAPGAIAEKLNDLALRMLSRHATEDLYR